MSGVVARITYNGLTPAADANTYTLFSSVASGFAGNMQGAGIKKVLLDMKNAFSGTLKWYKSENAGVTWVQLDQEAIGVTASTSSVQREYLIEGAKDWKLDWVNGGTNQTTWVVDIGLSVERAASGVQVGDGTSSAGGTGAIGTHADAEATPTLGGLYSYMKAYNGATWDYVRSAIVAKTATFTGILNSLVMGRYNSSPPALTSGDVQLLQLDASGNLRGAEQFAPVAEDNTVGVYKVEQRFSYTNMTTATTTTIKSGAGFLHGVVIGTSVASATVKLFDNTAGSGTSIGVLTCSSALSVDPVSTIFDVSFSTGLTVVTSGATDVTLLWR